MRPLLIVFLLLAGINPAQASSLLQLGGDGRVATVFTSYEIPDYLRTSKCSYYIYEQKFGSIISGGNVSNAAPAGTTEEDIRILRDRKICVLRLRLEAMLKGTVQPITIYEIDILGRGANETHVGQNLRHMDNGKYELENGQKFRVKNDILITRDP